MRSPAPARRRGRVTLLATAGLASLAALAVAAPAQAFNREGPHWPTAKLTVDTTAVPAGTFHDALADAAAEYTARTHALPSAELRSTASSTRCTRRPSANEGWGSRPAAMSCTRSRTWWVNECS